MTDDTINSIRGFSSRRFRRSPFLSPWRGAARAAALAALAARAWQPFAEFALLLNDPVYRGWGVPRGDGHSVLVLPGLLGGDRYLEALRGWLRRIGYTPVRSGIDRNPGWSEELVDEIGAMVEREFERSGRRLTLIGHSMGGVLARSVAIRRPHAVLHVVALGSPLRMGRGHLPDHVRMTAIYTRDDRIVRYPGALAREPGAQNIEVVGSHTGLAVNPAVYRRLGHLLPESAKGAAGEADSRDRMV